MKRRTTAAVLAAAAATAITGATISTAAASSSAAPVKTAKLHLVTSSPKLATCFPHAKADVEVKLTTDTIGKDTFRIVAGGLKPKTDFTVFLLKKAGAPFGAAEYIGDFTTDRWGNASNEFTLIVEEAFALQRDRRT